MSEVDDQIARARATMERISVEYRRGGGGGGGGSGASRDRQRQVQDLGRRVKRIGVAVAAIVAVAIVAGLVIGGIGMFGFLAMIVAIVAAVIFLGGRSTERPVSYERLVQSDIKALPAQTERWLAAQRPQLPAPAASLLDRIGQRLDTLSPQLVRVDNDAPEAAEVRKLVAEQLPAFVNDYARVPATLRGEARNGRTPDMELVDGLKLIEQEIGEMTQRLAAADLDQLSTRGRFLEMKYKDGEQG